MHIFSVAQFKMFLDGFLCGIFSTWRHVISMTAVWQFLMFYPPLTLWWDQSRQKLSCLIILLLTWKRT